MSSRLKQLLPVMILVFIMLLVALSAGMVFANNVPNLDADTAFHVNLIIMRIKVQQFIADSWINEEIQNERPTSESPSQSILEIKKFEPWSVMVGSNN
jgi:hypothetical protein